MSLLFLLPLLLLPFSSLSFSSSSSSSPYSSSPSLYQVDLDLPPSLRYQAILQDHKEALVELYNAILDKFGVPSFLSSVVTWYAERFYHDQELLEEFRAVSEETGVNLGGVFLMNHLYEIFALCTSIVTQNSTGHIIHGRNLDYPFKEHLGNLSIKVEYLKNGKVLFVADTIAGFSGILTGHKQGSFGVSINERHSGTIGSILATLYDIFVRNYYPVPYFMRKVLESANSYSEAVELFKNQPFANRCYLIVSGVNRNEGVVITRGRSTVDNISTLNDDDWFLVQTNYDRDLPDPADDYRRVPAEEKLKKIGKDNVDRNSLFDIILSQIPNWRPTETITSAVLEPQGDYFNTTIWL